MLNKWVDPDYQGGPMQKVLVLALFEGAVTRAHWEETLARELEEFEVDATLAYEMLPDAMPDSTAIFDAARRAGCDGIVVIYESYTDTTDATYIEGYIEQAYQDVWPTPPVYVDIYFPPHTVYELTINWDVEVWTAPEDVRMVWAGTSAVIDPKVEPPAREIVAGWIGHELALCGLVRSGF